MRVHRGHRHPPGGPPPLSDPVSGNSRRWVVFALATVGFFISMFYRVSVAVISPDLAAQLHLDNNQLSQLSAIFFWVFAANQVPLLMTLDRLGPRLTTGLLQVAGVGGAVIFALAPTFPAALLGRALLGLGMSCNLMGPLALVANWFPVNRFGTLSGLAMVVGSLGNIAASSPLALMARHLGWRSSFLLIAALNLVWALCFVLLVRDRPPGSSGAPLKASNPLKGIGRLLTMRAYWCISLATFIRYGTYAAIQSLWAVPFLVFGLGLDAVEAGNVLLCMGIGAALAPLLMGTLSDQVLRSR